MPNYGGGLGIGWGDGGTIGILTVDDNNSWSQSFNPESAVGEPIPDASWIDPNNAYDWPAGNGETWGWEPSEDGTSGKFWLYNDSSEGVDDWEEGYEYTFHWIESDDGDNWNGFAVPFELLAYEGAQQLAAATAIIALLGLMM